MIYEPYKKFIENRLTLINKEGIEQKFILNKPQDLFVQAATGRDIILKARQEGFTSLIGGSYTADFCLKENSQSVVVADTAENAQAMLERVKWYIKSYEQNRNTKVPLKYNSKYELVNAAMNSRYSIGTAQNTEFGRSRTVFNAHLSEAAFYPHFRKILASLLQAVVTDGKVVIETTANGFNDFKSFWDESVLGNTGFKPHFFAASLLYTPEFLAMKRAELGEKLFMQEYPETAEEAFITSGDPYFEMMAMRYYLENSMEPLSV